MVKQLNNCTAFQVETLFTFNNGEQLTIEGYSMKGIRNGGGNRPVSATVIMKCPEYEFEMNSYIKELLYMSLPNVLQAYCSSNINLHPYWFIKAVATERNKNERSSKS